MDLPVPELSMTEEIEPTTPEDPEIEPPGGRAPLAARPEEDPEEELPEREEPQEG